MYGLAILHILSQSLKNVLILWGDSVRIQDVLVRQEKGSIMISCNKQQVLHLHSEENRNQNYNEK